MAEFEPRETRNRQEGGKGYWTKEKYTDGSGNVKWRDVWVQTSDRTKGSMPGGDNAQRLDKELPDLPEQWWQRD